MAYQAVSQEVSSFSFVIIDGFVKSPISPANRLEKLKGERAGQYSIRINDQWRICFTWKNEDAFDVEIVDYHRG
jgi:Txe/YoeB family toxin of Txe-Axe toxin-antitoxin module